MLTSLLQDIIKDTDEQADKKMRKGRPGRVLSTGVLAELGVSLCQCVDVFANQKLPKSCAIEIFMEASSCRHAQLLSPFSVPLPLWRIGVGWGWEGG